MSCFQLEPSLLQTGTFAISLFLAISECLVSAPDVAHEMPCPLLENGNVGEYFLDFCEVGNVTSTYPGPLLGTLAFDTAATRYPWEWVVFALILQLSALDRLGIFTVVARSLPGFKNILQPRQKSCAEKLPQVTSRVAGSALTQCTKRKKKKTSARTLASNIATITLSATDGLVSDAHAPKRNRSSRASAKPATERKCQQPKVNTSFHRAEEPTYRPKDQLGRAGIVNFGNTCFASSCLHLLVSFPPVSKFIADLVASGINVDRLPAVKTLCDLFMANCQAEKVAGSDSWSEANKKNKKVAAVQERSAVLPAALPSLVSKFRKCAYEEDTNAIGEPCLFLEFLLKELDTEIRQLQGEGCKVSGEWLSSMNGELVSELTEDQAVFSRVHETFSLLNLVVSEQSGPVTVQDLLTNFGAVEALSDFRINDIQAGTSRVAHVTKQYQFCKPPEVLLLQFSHVGMWLSGNSVNTVQVCNSVELRCQGDTMSAHYKLAGGVSYRPGIGGHFVAKVPDWQKQHWVICDDENVRLEGPKDQNVMPYVLAYYRT